MKVIFLSITILFLFSCKKDTAANAADYASEINGRYPGALTITDQNSNLIATISDTIVLNRIDANTIQISGFDTLFTVNIEQQNNDGTVSGISFYKQIQSNIILTGYVTLSNYNLYFSYDTLLSGNPDRYYIYSGYKQQ